MRSSRRVRSSTKTKIALTRWRIFLNCVNLDWWKRTAREANNRKYGVNTSMKRERVTFWHFRSKISSVCYFLFLYTSPVSIIHAAIKRIITIEGCNINVTRESHVEVIAIERQGRRMKKGRERERVEEENKKKTGKRRRNKEEHKRKGTCTHLFPFVQYTRRPAVGQQCSYFLGLA